MTIEESKAWKASCAPGSLGSKTATWMRSGSSNLRESSTPRGGTEIPKYTKLPKVIA